MKICLSHLKDGGPQVAALRVLLKEQSIPRRGGKTKVMLSAVEHGAQAEAFPVLLKPRERETRMKLMLSGVENPGRGNMAEILTEREGKDMKMMLSGSNDDTIGMKPYLRLTEDINPNPPLLWNLCSYYYMRGNEYAGTLVRNNSREIMVDSGAFSFQMGAKGNYDTYVKEYAEFIERWDRPNVIGFFEMDIDKIVGYDKVLEYRRQLEHVTDKIIPVWHNTRGIAEFKRMCEDYSGRIVAVTGVHKEIRDGDYVKFLKTAHDYGCKLHCLGMTRKEILDVVPFDYVDSASWCMGTVFGRVGKHKRKIDQEYARINRGEVFAYSYLEAMKTQMHYYQKWRSVCHD